MAGQRHGAAGRVFTSVDAIGNADHWAAADAAGELPDSGLPLASCLLPLAMPPAQTAANPTGAARRRADGLQGQTLILITVAPAPIKQAGVKQVNLNSEFKLQC